MLNQKKLEIFLVKIRKSLAKQFLEVAFNNSFATNSSNFLDKICPFFLSSIASYLSTARDILLKQNRKDSPKAQHPSDLLKREIFRNFPT